MYEYVYLLAIAGHTAGPNWLIFFKETLGEAYAKKLEYISKIDFLTLFSLI